jgi:glycosyltransferase involved in cell wall biosynthesis
MHASLPIIGTPVGGIKETISEDGERGFYWLGDLKDFEEKINLCLSGEEKKAAMIQRAKEYVKKKLLIKTDINKIYNQEYEHK